MHHYLKNLSLLVLLLALSPVAAQDTTEPAPKPKPQTQTFRITGPDQTLFLTWLKDPTTTITVQWVVPGGALMPIIRITEADQEQWRLVMGYREPFPNCKAFRYRVLISGLTPATAYQFQVGNTGPIYKFHTAPATLDKPITFVSGGDVIFSDITEKINRQAAKHDPLFALVGGDIAYANGKKVLPWLQLLGLWRKTMVRSDGSLIPLLAAIGNHEVHGAFNQPTKHAPFFYNLFGGLFHDTGYASLTFGDYLQVILLDTDHTTPIDGKQTQWLKNTLAQSSQKAMPPYRFAFYHVPAYPSVRPWDHPLSARVREHWVPLFEQFNLNAAFEHHDHAYKRTHPMREGKIVLRGSTDRGILYIGDGAWGIPNLRDPRPLTEATYNAKTAKAHHVILTTLTPTEQTHTVITPDGSVLDTFTRPRTKNAGP